MTDKRKINLTSLNVVRDELVVTIEQAATHLEGFVVDRENDKLLNDCVESLQQIRGSLDLIQLYGASELAGELLHTATTIKEGKKALEDERLSALTRGFFVLSCYFEYALNREKGMPVLLISYINDIRIANLLPILPESYFTDSFVHYRKPKGEPSRESDNLQAEARRYRHMYQIGLVSTLRELNLSGSLNMMHRAVQKLHTLAQGSANETFWWLAGHTISLFQHEKLSINMERKRLLSQLDGEFKKVEKQGETSLGTQTNEALIKELAYYVGLSGVEEAPYNSIAASFGFGDLGYTEQKYIQEKKDLTGPSASTVLSVAQTLREELLSAKEIIEMASENAGGTIDTYDELIGGVTKVKDILAVVGLLSASETMDDQLKKFNQWSETNEEIAANELFSVADAFLYVESVLLSIENHNFSDEKLNELNNESRESLMMSSHLQGAQLVVLEEAESGLSMIKRALTAFTDSGYDRAHIKNIPKTFNGVRGGLIVLELPRAVSVVESAIQFIEGALLSNNQPAAIEHMLETFADALICLEYYLDCMKIDKYINSDTLVVAEESLSALGYGVSYTGE